MLAMVVDRRQLKGVLARALAFMTSDQTAMHR